MTIASKLATINEALGDIKSSIVAKGVTPTGDITTYSTAIDDISGGGDEITATNTTGSTVSADDRVWVEPINGDVENFTKVGTVNITDKVAQSLDTNNYISFQNVNFGNNTWEYQTAIYFTTITSGPKTVLSNPFQINVQFTGNSIFLFLSSNGTSWDINSTSHTDFQIPNQTKYYIKVVFDGSKYLLQTSADGSSWTTRITVNNSTKIFNSLEDIAIGKSSNVIDYLYLEDTYVKVNGNIVWTPYKEAVVGYSIINDTDITSTSFTGIAQANIANNATGSVKTLLDGNGTYAPTTATKSITTNGTYTASAENAYGLSEVTVNVSGGGMDTVEAANNTGSAITNGDKVWINQSGGSYTLENYNVYEINCNKYGSPTISNSVASNFTTSNYLLTKNIIDTQSYNSWEFNIKIRTPSDVYGGKTGYGYYFCGGPAYDAGSLNYSFLFQLYHNNLNCLMSSNGTSWDISIGGNSVAISANTDYFLKLVFTGTQYIFSYSTDGVTYTTISTTTSSLKINNDKISFGKAFANSPDTSFSGSFDFSQSYFIADGVKIWDGYTASGRINAPDTVLTGTAAENIAIGGTGDVEIGEVIEPTLGTKTITANGTYNASTDNLDGFSSVTVDVPSSSGVGITREVSAQGVYQKPANSFTFSLPSNATDIGDYGLYSAFYNCTGLTSIDLSALTTVSGYYGLYCAFRGCTGLTSVDLSSLTTILGSSAFYSAFQDCTGLTSVDLSALTTILGAGALGSAFSGCTGLKDIYFRALTTTSFGSTFKNQFYNMLSNTGTTTTHTLHFPSNLQSTISGLQGYPLFGGTSGYVTCLFDLPETPEVEVDSDGGSGGGR